MKKILMLFIVVGAITTTISAQTDTDICEDMWFDANNYFNKGKYESALKMFTKLDENHCRDVTAKIKECNKLIQEEKDFKRCYYSINGCESYLKRYPKGMYVAKAQKRLSDLLAQETANAEEDDAAFSVCHNEEACDDYLQRYPRGRHLDEVLSMKMQYQEEREALEAALRLEWEMEASKTAFMDIQRIEFANLDAKNNIINDFDSTLYAANLKILTPKIIYEGIYDIPQIVTVYCKLFDPDGELMTAPGSPDGFTFKNTILVRTGEDNSYRLSGYGSSTIACFTPGDYMFELWYQDTLLYQTPVAINDKGDALTNGYWRKSLSKCCDNPTHPPYADGGLYKGQLQGFDRSGLGIYTWNTEAFYIGEWKAKYKDGVGIDIVPDGSQISNCPSAQYYVGEMCGNKKSGRGRCYDKYGNLIYEGSFSNDSPSEAYPSKIDNGLKFVCLNYSFGCYYVGETKNGKCHGKGMLIWRWNGEMWYGSFLDGERNGYGLFVPYEGNVSTGYWIGDEKQ